MRSFKNYSPQGGNEGKKAPKNHSGSEEIGKDTTSSAADLTRKLASSWDGRDKNEMLAEILSEAEKSKRAGTLSNAEIDKFFADFSPLLGDAQRRRLKKVVESLKKI